jgi:AcrR family transcriptional regulator
MRKSAEVRREEILAVAMEHFAEGGYHGTSTEVIAKQAGISQPYLFRLFRTKRELFLACDDRACEKVLDAFRRAAAAAPAGEELRAMGQA